MKTTEKRTRIFLTLAVAFTLLLSTVSCGAYADMPKSIGTELREGKTVKVTTADEFLAAIANDTTIMVETELLDFSTATDYGKGFNDHYYWMETYDGPCLIIRDTENLQIIGRGKDKTTLQVTPRYAEVLHFENCSAIQIANLTAGHLKDFPGSCMGDVFEFENCRNVNIENCGLFGCGVNGILASDCDSFGIRNTEMYECSSFGALLSLCTRFAFEECSVHDCVANAVAVFGTNGDITWDGKALEQGENYVN